MGSLELSDVQATLLMPLWARSVESRRPNPIFYDPHSIQICDQVPYDFDRFVRNRVDTMGYCMRAAIVDGMVRDFLEQHPDARVVELGVGLDVRHLRLDNGRAEWLQIDLPDAIALRERVIPASPRRRVWSGSATDAAWMSLLNEADDRPLMVTADALFFFLDDASIRTLLCEVAQRFPGAEFVFDAASPEYLWYCNLRHPLADSSLKWSLRSVAKIAAWSPEFRLRRYVGFGDSPSYDPFRTRLPWLLRGARACLPPIRHAYKIMQWTLGTVRPVATN